MSNRAADALPADAGPRRLGLLYAAILLCAGLAAYSNSFTSLFVGLDAKESVRDNPYIRTLWPLSAAMSLDLLSDTVDADDGSKGGTVVRRPILSLSFALNHHFFGPGAEGFHAINLVIHLAAGLLLFGILRRLLGGPDSLRSTHRAAAIAVLWVVHPLQTESVTYLVQRAESLMGMFYLATLYASLRFFDEGRRGWAVLAVVACGLGMGAKESMVTAPLVVLLCDAVFRSPTPLAALRLRPLFYAALAATWSVLFLLIVWTAADAAKDFREGRTLDYFLSQPAAILHYLRLALWPDDLNLYVNTYAFQFRWGESSWLALSLRFAVVGGLFAYGAMMLRRRRPIGFAVACFFLVLAPTSSVVATSDILQEHRVYLALAAVIAAVVIAGEGILRALLPAPRAALAGLLLVTTATAALGARTYVRNHDYRDEFSAIFPGDLQESYRIMIDHELRLRTAEEVEATAHAILEDADATVAERAYAHFTLGVVADRHRNFPAAEQRFRRVVEMQPDQPAAHVKLGIVLLEQGRREEAEAAFRRAIEIEPLYADAHHELGILFRVTNRHDEARQSFETAIALRPWYPESIRELAIWHAERQALDEARSLLANAVRMRPDDAATHHELARVLNALGQEDDARRHFERAWKLLNERTPSDSISPHRHHELGLLNRQLGNWERANQHFHAALAINPSFAPAILELAVFERSQQNYVEAERLLEQAIERDPIFTEAYVELGTMILDELHDAVRAEVLLRKALALHPDHPDAIENLGVALLRQDDLRGAERQFERVQSIARDRDLARRRLEYVRTLLQE